MVKSHLSGFGQHGYGSAPAPPPPLKNKKTNIPIELLDRNMSVLVPSVSFLYRLLRGEAYIVITHISTCHAPSLLLTVSIYTTASFKDLVTFAPRADVLIKIG